MKTCAAGLRRCLRARPGHTRRLRSMRAVNPPPNPAEVVRSQARYQLERLNRTYNDLWPHGPRNEGSDLGILEAFTLRHPMTAATKEQAAIHEAGHSIAYERLGMMMNGAE